MKVFFKWVAILFGLLLVLLIGLIAYEQYQSSEKIKRYRASWVKPTEWNSDLQKMLDDCVNRTGFVAGMPDNDDPKYVRVSTKRPGKIAIAYGGKFEGTPPRAFDHQAAFCVYDAKTMAREEVMHSEQGKWKLYE